MVIVLSACPRCGRETAQNWLYCPFCGRGILTPHAPKKRDNGLGSAYKRGNTWTAQVTLYSYLDKNGKLRQKLKRKGGFRTKKEAVAFLETLRKADERKVPTLLDLYTIYEANDLPKLSKDKQTAYKKARERLEPIIGRKIDTLTTADLQTIVNSQASSHYTAKDMKTVLSKCYARACADQFVPSNLAQYIVLPELEEAEPEPFTSDEVNAMWRAFSDGDMFVGYLLVMIYSGMMPGELMACKKDMIDFDRCEIYGCGKKTKLRKTSTIVFAESVKPVLQSLCALEDKERLYPHNEKTFYSEYGKAIARLGIRYLPPYSCRHTTGTEAAKQNLNASIIQKIMRHAKITTSQRYIHLGTEEAHSAINTISHSPEQGVEKQRKTLKNSNG
jgi:integrase